MSRSKSAPPTRPAAADQTHQVSTSVGLGDGGADAANRVVASRVRRRARVLEQPAQPSSSSWPRVQDTPSATGGSALTAHATVQPAATAATGPTTQGSLSRIETDYASLRLLAISLEKMARDEIARLSGERPNDPYTIESNKKQSDLLSILADGFAKIAAARIERRSDCFLLLSIV